MKTKMFLLTLVFASVPFSSAYAQELVPATSEDLELFDKQLSDSMRANKAEKADRKEAKETKDGKKQNDRFGQTVSNEAKRLRDSDDGSRKDFGKWVSSQRRKNEQKDNHDTGQNESAAQDVRTETNNGKNPGKGKDKQKN